MDGFILQNYLTGIGFKFNLYEEKGIPFIISAGIYKGEKEEELLGIDSFDPIVFFESDYLLNLSEGFSFSFLFFNDKSNFFGTMLNNALQQTILPLLEPKMKRETDPVNYKRMENMYNRIAEGSFKQTEGSLYWFNIHSKKCIGDFLFKWGFSLEFGDSDVSYQDIFTGEMRAISIDFLGYGGSFRVNYKGSRTFEPFLSFIYVSGDEDPFDFRDKYSSFLGLYPYII